MQEQVFRNMRMIDEAVAAHSIITFTRSSSSSASSKSRAMSAFACKRKQEHQITPYYLLSKISLAVKDPQ